MKARQRSQLAQVNRLIADHLRRLSSDGFGIRIEITPMVPNGSSHVKGECAWPGCHKRVTGVRCRRHAQLVRSQETRLNPGRFREPHQRPPLVAGGYDACDCGRPKLASEKECDVCRELNKHRQAPGR